MALIQRKKDGGPSVKYFESIETVAQMDSVKSWLQKNYKKYIQTEPPTNKSLAALVCQLLQFQEDAFGKSVTKPALTKLPIRCFLDYKPGGGLSQILVSVFKFKTEQGWRRFDFQSPSRMDRNVEMFMQIQKSLLQSKALVQPAILLRPEIDKILTCKLKDIVKRHQGLIVDKPSEATHIIFPPPNSREEGEWLRPVAKRDRTLQVHWWYCPDSYDTWVMDVDYEQDIESGYIPESPWEVNALWLLDLEEYNEWMNEEDYVIFEEPCDDESSLSLIRPARVKMSSEELTNIIEAEKRGEKRIDKRIAKRRHSPSPSPAPTERNKKRKKGKRRNLVADEEDDEGSKDDDDVIIETSLSDTLIQKSLSAAKIAAEQGLSKNGVAEGEEETAATDASRMLAVGDQSERREESNLTEQTNHPIVVPSYSAWFDYGTIHAIEKKGLPEFFTGKNRSKTPEIFVTYRNFMVDSYRLNPQEYLTVTACRRNLAGDVCAIMRVHAFLDQWGLINYQVEPENRPTPMGPPTTSHFHILCDTPSGLHALNPPKSSQPPSISTKLNGDSDKAATEKKEADEKKEGTGSILGNIGLKMDQYAKQEKDSSVKGRDWTDQETLLLLEGLEMFKDDWNRVSEHVGTRTQDECILHFLRLPIEDPYLEEGPAGGHLGPLVYQPLPFSQNGNPIMSTVAFLASVVDPRVAKSAVTAALDEFSKMKEEVPPPLIDTHLKSVEEAIKDGVSVDANFGLDKTGIAGTGAEEDKEQDKGSDVSKPSEEVEEKKNGVEQTSDSNQKKPEETAEKSTNECEKPEDLVKEPCQPDTAASESSPAKETADAETTPATASKDILTAAANVLSMAAAKAKNMASMEERKIKSLVALLVETQMRKLEIKLRHFEEMESIMDHERESLEFQRQELLREQQQFHLEQLRAAELRAKQLAAQQLVTEPPQQSAAAHDSGASSDKSGAVNSPAAPSP